MKREKEEWEETGKIYTMKSEEITFDAKKMKNHTKLDFLLKLI